jgi:hypothetical protein
MEITAGGGSVRFLAYKTGKDCKEVVGLLQQAVTAGHLVESGTWGNKPLYSPVKA